MGDGWGSWEPHSRSRKFSRPPQHPGSLQSAVPSWEKTFCSSVCSIPWGRILVAKASLSSHKSIAEWDDAAALEAFQNAKARYWAYINGLPSDVPLPDADLYIERVDHNAVIDPKLVEDLEKQTLPPPSKSDDISKNSWEPFISFASKPVQVTGSENAEDGDLAEHQSVDWDQFIEKGDSSNAWKCGGGWGDATTEDCSWGGRGNNNSWNNEKETSWGQRSSNMNNERGGRNNMKINGGQYDSRISNSRYHVNNCQRYNNWNGGYPKRNMTDYHYEKTVRGGQPIAMRQSKSRRYYGPGNHQRSPGSGGA